MSIFSLDKGIVKTLLEDDSIAKSIVETWINEDLNHVFSNYLEKKDTRILDYLLDEEDFGNTLSHVLTYRMSKDVLDDILCYIEQKEPNREIIDLQQKMFSSVAEFCQHYQYTLTNKELAKIIKRWPDDDWDSIWMIMMMGFIDIKTKFINNDLHLCNVLYDDKGENPKVLQDKMKYISTFQSLDADASFRELSSVVDDKSLYEVLSVDVIEVIKHRYATRQ